MEVPRLQPYELALPIDAAMFSGALLLDVRVVSEPLLAQHGAKCSEQAGRKTGVQEALDPDGEGTGASEYRESEGLVREDRVVGDGLSDDHKKDACGSVWIGTEVRLHQCQEGRDNAAEKTSLYRNVSEQAYFGRYEHTHKNQGDV